MTGNSCHIPRLFTLSLAFTILFCCSEASIDDDRKAYIVYLGELPKGDISASSLHTNMLEAVVVGSASEYLVHSYKRSFNGFSAKLTSAEAQKLADMDGVVSIFPSKMKQLHTTRSWDFIGFPQNVQRSAIESDLIVGMLDTGVWPESDSFKDANIGPPPSKWKGSCDHLSNFTCNNKIVGAKFYYGQGNPSPPDVASPRDNEGHGTHTASTAAGNLVAGANLFDLGLGTARGAVPSARIAVYKICWFTGCSDDDILAAFDDAIADGVDLISISVGGESASDYFKDSIAIGAFHAMKNGILTSQSAGNSGPTPSTITSVAPWSLSVAASTIDRKFLASLQLGDNKIYEGFAINTFNMKNTTFPMIYGGDAPANGSDSDSSRYCEDDSLDQTKVQGKIVLCDELGDGGAPFAVGAAGTVMQGSSNYDFGFTFPLPATYLDAENGSQVFKYLKSASQPTGVILKSIATNDTLAPSVVSFSSRGPNPITNDILKPDIAAPGVDILAAWSPDASLTDITGDVRSVSYNIISGTSMACPHASGAALYVKSIHPSWSAAAIKSALMTTAIPMSILHNTDAEFAYGAGQIDPVKAADPGLIYDAAEVDFVNFLCGQGYSSKNIQLITGDNVTCSKVANFTVWDLNYPSFALSSASASISRVFSRTVTNVGSANSTYKAIVNAPSGLTIKVDPIALSFQSAGQKLSFTVYATANLGSSTLSGSLAWDDGVHQVRSPIVAYSSS